MGRPRAAGRAGAGRGVRRREALAAGSFAELADALAADGVQSVLIGSAADADAASGAEVVSALAQPAPLSISIGRTDLSTLAGVCRTAARSSPTTPAPCIWRAAVGMPVTAMFGPTDERATRGRSATAHAIVLTHPVWCRPCMLRECPLDHRCMRGIERRPRSLDGGAQRACDAAVAVFLDRDGTLIEDVGYLDRLDQLAFFPWTVDAIRALNRAGLPVVVITNQSGVARGFFTEAFVDEVHRRSDARGSTPAARASTRITIVRTIPTAAVAEYAQRCDCRKPGARTGRSRGRAIWTSIRRASFVVGDTWLDVALARAVGARGDPGANGLRRGRGAAAGPRI